MRSSSSVLKAVFGFASWLRAGQDQRVGRGDGVGVAGGSDHGVTGGQGGLGDVDAHPAAGARDEPNLLVSHASALPSVALPVHRRVSHRIIGGAL
jgi:hypothetical protein